MSLLAGGVDGKIHLRAYGWQANTTPLGGKFFASLCAEWSTFNSISHLGLGRQSLQWQFVCYMIDD